MVSMTSKSDQLLVQIGTGKWNLLYLLASAWWCLLLPGQILSVIFVAPSVQFSCRPDLHQNISDEALEGSCSYLTNDTESSSGNKEHPCVEWDFNNSTFVSTLTSEFDLVCSRDYVRSTYHAVFMFGNMFGPMIAGVLSDRYGRWPVVAVGVLLFTACSFLLVFLYNLVAILAVRFIMGFANLPTGYILALEICEPKIRPYAGILMVLPWALGTMALSGVAYFIRDWRWLQLTVSLPMLISLPILWYLDESPRWLIVQGKHSRALRVLRKAARWNKVNLPPDEDLKIIMMEIQQEGSTSSSTATSPDNSNEETKWDSRRRRRLMPCGLCSTPHMLLITAVMCFSFFVGSAVFYGLSMSAGNFNANIWAYVALGGLAEVPAYSLPAVIVAKYGRRLPQVLCYFVCGAALLLIAFIPENISWLIITLAMIGKLGISSASQMVFLYISELLPTKHRLEGLGAAVLTQRLGSISAPFIVHMLGTAHPWISSVLMGVLSILSGLATLLMPETLGAALPDTTDDVDHLFSRKRKSTEAVNRESVLPLQTQRT